MAWFKVDDGFWSHPKTLSLTAPALALWVRAGSWSCQQLTDGFIPVPALPMLGGVRRNADELVQVGYWDRADGGWVFHDWEDYQEASEVVKKRRRDARERMRNVRANKAGTSQEVRSTPTRPDPTRPTKGLSEVSSPSVTREEDETNETPARGVLAGLRIDPDRLAKHINQHTGRNVTTAGAMQIALDRLDRGADVKNPQAYVLRSVTRSWQEVQQFIDENGLSA
jgi:hypothetical protein